MKKNLVAVVALAVCPLLVAQQPVSASSQEAAAYQPPAVEAAQQTTLLDGTPVRLRISQTISSDEAKTGQEVAFEVIEDVNVDGIVVIKKGDTAFGTVTKAQSKRMMGRGGKLDLGINYVRLSDQQKVSLRGSKDSKGHGSTTGMTVGIAASAVLFFPAAPLFLLMHGKDVTITQGTEVTAYVQGDTRVDVARLGAVSPAAGLARPIPSPSATTLTSLVVDSNPLGADIEIAGAFVGSTPSTISVPPGTYQIAIKKTGYTTWIRTLDVRRGAVHVSAALEGIVAAR